MSSESVISAVVEPISGTSVRAAARWALAGVAAVLLVFAVVALAVSGQGLAWLIGLLAGAAAGAGAALVVIRRRETRPAQLVHRRTAEVLEGLREAGWQALHDVAAPDGTYDHVAVGPGGVVLLESIAAPGTVVMRAGEPVEEVPVDGRLQLRRLRPQAHASAAELREAIGRCTGRRVWVQSVVVLWADFPEGCVVDGRCVYVHGSRLGEWMRRRPHQLPDEAIDGVVGDIVSLAAARDELLALAV